MSKKNQDIYHKKIENVSFFSPRNISTKVNDFYSQVLSANSSRASSPRRNNEKTKLVENYQVPKVGKETPKGTYKNFCKSTYGKENVDTTTKNVSRKSSAKKLKSHEDCSRKSSSIPSSRQNSKQSVVSDDKLLVEIDLSKPKYKFNCLEIGIIRKTNTPEIAKDVCSEPLKAVEVAKVDIGQKEIFDCLENSESIVKEIVQKVLEKSFQLSERSVQDLSTDEKFQECVEETLDAVATIANPIIKEKVEALAEDALIKSSCEDRAEVETVLAESKQVVEMLKELHGKNYEKAKEQTEESKNETSMGDFASKKTKSERRPSFIPVRIVGYKADSRSAGTSQKGKLSAIAPKVTCQEMICQTYIYGVDKLNEDLFQVPDDICQITSGDCVQQTKELVEKSTLDNQLGKNIVDVYLNHSNFEQMPTEILNDGQFLHPIRNFLDPVTHTSTLSILGPDEHFLNWDFKENTVMKDLKMVKSMKGVNLEDMAEKANHYSKVLQDIIESTSKLKYISKMDEKLNEITGMNEALKELNEVAKSPSKCLLIENQKQSLETFFDAVECVTGSKVEEGGINVLLDKSRCLSHDEVTVCSLPDGAHEEEEAASNASALSYIFPQTDEIEMSTVKTVDNTTTNMTTNFGNAPQKARALGRFSCPAGNSENLRKMYDYSSIVNLQEKDRKMESIEFEGRKVNLTAASSSRHAESQTDLDYATNGPSVATTDSQDTSSQTEVGGVDVTLETFLLRRQKWTGSNPMEITGLDVGPFDFEGYKKFYQLTDDFVKDSESCGQRDEVKIVEVSDSFTFRKSEDGDDSLVNVLECNDSNVVETERKNHAVFTCKYEETTDEEDVGKDSEVTAFGVTEIPEVFEVSPETGVKTEEEKALEDEERVKYLDSDDNDGYKLSKKSTVIHIRKFQEMLERKLVGLEDSKPKPVEPNETVQRKVEDFDKDAVKEIARKKPSVAKPKKVVATREELPMDASFRVPTIPQDVVRKPKKFPKICDDMIKEEASPIASVSKPKKYKAEPKEPKPKPKSKAASSSTNKAKVKKPKMESLYFSDNLSGFKKRAIQDIPNLKQTSSKVSQGSSSSGISLTAIKKGWQAHKNFLQLEFTRDDKPLPISAPTPLPSILKNGSSFSRSASMQRNQRYYVDRSEPSDSRTYLKYNGDRKLARLDQLPVMSNPIKFRKSPVPVKKPDDWRTKVSVRTKMMAYDELRRRLIKEGSFVDKKSLVPQKKSSLAELLQPLTVLAQKNAKRKRLPSNGDDRTLKDLRRKEKARMSMAQQRSYNVSQTITKTSSSTFSVERRGLNSHRNFKSVSFRSSELEMQKSTRLPFQRLTKKLMGLKGHFPPNLQSLSKALGNAKPQKGVEDREKVKRRSKSAGEKKVRESKHGQKVAEGQMAGDGETTRVSSAKDKDGKKAKKSEKKGSKRSGFGKSAVLKLGTPFPDVPSFSEPVKPFHFSTNVKPVNFRKMPLGSASSKR